MFKILHEIASNLHSPAACKMYTKLQKSSDPKPMKFLMKTLVSSLPVS